MASEKHKYGLAWPSSAHDLQIEFEMIKSGGFKIKSRGTYGLGLYQHYKNAMQLMWPDDDWHRWVEIMLRTAAENSLTSWMGSADSGKSFLGAKWALTEWWSDPKNTLVLISSTDIRGLELRIWGAIKDLFNRARERFDFLVGQPLDSIHSIVTAEIDVDGEQARQLNRGIVCIPCLASGRYIGLKNYIGIKAPRLRQVNDEVTLMGPSHLDALSNYVGKDYKGLFLFNPNDPLDCGGRVAEPECGWQALPEPTKTTVWKTKMLGGACVNLVGTDSPNFDYPKEPVRFKYLVNYKKIDFTKNTFGEDSYQYWSQCKGVMKTGLLARRVITEQFCKQHRAFEKAIWQGTPLIRLWALDAAYSGVGGDRCIFIWGEFGESEDGHQILRVSKPELIPVKINMNKTPEAQISAWISTQLPIISCSPENGFYDSTGRGTLGNAFAKDFGSATPKGVEFGGKPSARPVRHDLFIGEGDERRLKRCDEHYVDMVSELWMTTQYLIFCEQLRELPNSVMLEGQQREYGTHKNRMFVESKNDPKAKERMRHSPDEYDAFCTLCEGARRLGFQLSKLGVAKQELEKQDSWWEKENQEIKAAFRKNLLTHG